MITTNNDTQNNNHQHSAKNLSSRESNYAEFVTDILTPFWNSRQQGLSFNLRHKKLYWASFTHPQHTKAIVIVNGRIESVYKYQELLFDFFQQGYDVFSYDHQGQGLSERTTNEKQLGHIDDFADYVDDLKQMVQQFSLDKYQQRLILGHSMGGAIATRYLQTCPSIPFNAAILSAPMLGIALAPGLKPIARPLMFLLSHCYKNPRYAPGQKNYQASPFANNHLTHSKARYQWFRELYRQNKQLQLGGPSNQWVYQSLIACNKCYQQVHKIKIPLLLLQAGDDQIVDNQAQRRFMTKLAYRNPATHFHSITGARHELLFESDPLRQQALKHIEEFIKLHK